VSSTNAVQMESHSCMKDGLEEKLFLVLRMISVLQVVLFNEAAKHTDKFRRAIEKETRGVTAKFEGKSRIETAMKVMHLQNSVV
jgi:hypothetical protein